MVITLRWWQYIPNTFKPDYGRCVLKEFSGDTAEECMKQIDDYKYYRHDLAKFTPAEIINVRD